MSEIDELKARIKQLEDEREHIIALLNKYFEKPCQYDFGDVFAYDFIDKVDGQRGISWCEDHCKPTGFEGDADCWRRFLDLMMKAEKEQMEYGKEQIDD